MVDDSGTLQNFRSWPSLHRRCKDCIRLSSSWSIVATQCSSRTWSAYCFKVAVTPDIKVLELSNVVGGGAGVIKQNWIAINSFIYAPGIIRIRQRVPLYVPFSLVFSDILLQSCDYRFVETFSLPSRLLLVRRFLCSISKKTHNHSKTCWWTAFRCQ